MNTRHGLKRIDTHCPGADTELGPCAKPCGREICLLRADCVRPVVLVQRTVPQRIARLWRIWRAKARVRDLKQQYRDYIKGGFFTAEDLVPLRLQIGAARVARAIEMRP